MKLEDISAEIRPRNEWESVDLGFALTRRCYGACLRSWMITVLPVWALVLGLMHQNLVWAMLLLWWWKPIFERVPLFVLSRSLFGEVPSPWQVLRAWPKMMGRRLWYTLVPGRLSPSRPMIGPVVELEGLKGNELRQRKDSVTTRSTGSCLWMQILLLMVLHSVWLAVIATVYFLIPAQIRPPLEDLWAKREDLGDAGVEAMKWAWVILYFAALTLVSPFLIGGGFGLYLNARTRIEGWDIELAFRQLGNRLRSLGQGGKQVALILVTGFLVWGGLRPKEVASQRDPGR
ncbi:MAG: hypothetical protein AAGJ31_11225, partial [Verrucomicrobiota bacterium]